MTLLHPGFLWLLIPIGILFVYREKRIVETVHLLILALIVAAMSRPVLLQGVQESPIEAREYTVALDVSYSMRAKDIRPDRYTFAKETIAALLRQNPADNVMLIAFTTNPLLLSPPTTDHRLIEVALESLEPKNILTKGTSLERLLKRVAAIPRKEKYLLLMSDGGEEKDIEKLRDIVHRGHIHLIVLALGTEEGSTVEQEDGTLLKDREAHLVVTRINPLLKSLVSATGGSYVTVSSSPQSTAKELYEALMAQSQRTGTVSKKQHRYTELYVFPLFTAALLFLLLHTRAVRYLLLLLPLLGIEAQASMLDSYRIHKAYEAYGKNDLNTSEAYLKALSAPSLQSRFALASLYYRKGDYKKALQYYRSIRSTSPAVKQKLYYNIGNCYAQQQAYEKAKIYYTKALQLGEDADASANLAYVLFLKEKKEAKLGIAHPKSQGSDASKGRKQDEGEEKGRDEDQPSSGSGSGGKNGKSKKEQARRRLLLDPKAEEHPLSSKVYELINKGYIHEKTPW